MVLENVGQKIFPGGYTIPENRIRSLVGWVVHKGRYPFPC